MPCSQTPAATSVSGAVYFLLERVIRFAANASAAVLQGLVLGVLSHERLERLTAERYLRDSVTRGTYADPAYLDSGLFLWERDAVQQYFPPGGTVLVAAAGAGREMIALARAGFRVDGFDCCPPLVAAGQKVLRDRGVSARLEYAAPSAVPAGSGVYDAILVGFSGYMYIAGPERRIDFLRNLCAQLRPGGPLMVSFTEGYSGKRRVWTAKIGTTIRRLRGAPAVEEGDCLQDGFQHHFTFDQIVMEMKTAGLHLIHYSGGTCYGHAVGIRQK